MPVVSFGFGFVCVCTDVKLKWDKQCKTHSVNHPSSPMLQQLCGFSMAKPMSESKPATYFEYFQLLMTFRGPKKRLLRAAGADFSGRT